MTTQIDSIQRIIDNAEIPSPPAVAARIIELVSQPDNDMRLITKVVGADPKLSARLIDYCNSPIVGSKRKVSTLQQAVMVLGMRTLRLLSLSFSVMETESDSEFDYDAFWRGSLANAIASKAVASLEHENGDELFLLGLLLNVGQIGLCITYPKEAAELAEKHPGSKARLLEAEGETFGATRFEVGACLLEKWHFPLHMVEALRTYDPANLSEVAKPLYLGDLIAELLLSPPDDQKLQETKKQALELFKIDDAQFADLFEQIVSEWKGYEELFNYESIPYESMKDLERLAKESMMQISLDMDSEIRQMMEEKRTLEKAALIDPLTNLKNRVAYSRELPHSLDYLKQQCLPLGLIVIDIDHFKSINDTYGHAVGDQVLREVGKCLSARCRFYDNIYRYGGEEFVALIADADCESTCIIAERLRTAIGDLQIQIGRELTIKITASLGICWVDSGEPIDSLESLFSRADANLYQAKRAGRNRIVCGRLHDACV